MISQPATIIHDLENIGRSIWLARQDFHGQREDSACTIEPHRMNRLRAKVNRPDGPVSCGSEFSTPIWMRASFGERAGQSNSRTSLSTYWPFWYNAPA